MSSSSRNSRSVGGGRVTAASCHHNHHVSSPSSSPYYSYYYYNSSLPSASTFASTTSSFGSSSRSTSSSSSFHHHHHYSNSSSYSPHHHHHHHGHSYNRSTSPTRVNFVGSVASAPSVRFSLDPRSISPGRSFPAVHHHHNHHHSHQHRQSSHNHHPIPQQPRRTCMCSPTTHPGSFRCSLHKNIGYQSGGGHHHLVMQQHSLSAPSNRLNARRSAMTNSLVRIGTVEGDLVKRALAALIRPSSHQQRRRAAFHRRPSRLSIMSCAGDDNDDGVIAEV